METATDAGGPIRFVELLRRLRGGDIEQQNRAWAALEESIGGVRSGMEVKLSDEQWLRILECLNLRVSVLEKKQQAIDDEIRDELHALRGIANTIQLMLHKKRMTK